MTTLLKATLQSSESPFPSRRRRSALAMLLAVALTPLALLMPTQPAAAAGPAVQVADSLTVVRPTETPSGALTNSASLVAARGEYESFQLVVTGPATVTSVSNDLFGWGTTGVYLERFYTVANGTGLNPQPSDLESDGPNNSWAPHGRWPDPLIPDRDQIYNQKRNAFPFTVPSGEKWAVWVDVFVPYDQPSGTYADEIVVSTAGGSTSIDVDLEVLNWTMPATSSLNQVFMVSSNGRSHICKAHTNSNDCDADKAKRATLNSLYTRMGLENRVTQSNGFGLLYSDGPGFYAGADWTEKFEAPLILGTANYPADAGWNLDQPVLTKVSAFAYAGFHCGTTCASQWQAKATQPGKDWSDRFIWYGCDEGGSSGVLWGNCKASLDVAQAAWNRPALVTSTYADWLSTGSKTDIANVTTLVPYFHRLNPAGGASTRPSYDPWVNEGNEVWLATACDASYCQGLDPSISWTYPVANPANEPAPNSSLGSYGIGSPSYQVDAPANQARVMPWQLERWNLQGELYWSTDELLETAWDTGGLYYEGANGDGTLFYPGTPSEIGGTSDIPIESIRLKRMRDGREDYEYFVELRDRGLGAQLDAILATAYPNMFSATWAKDGHGAGTMLDAREQIVDLLRDAVAGEADPYGGPGATPVQKTGYIVYQSDEDGDAEIFAIKPNGTGKVQLTRNTVFDGFPAWSPDSTRIAWEQGGEVKVMNADGTGTPVTVASGGGTTWSKPAWSPDGTALFFTGTAAGTTKIYRSPIAAPNPEFVVEGYDPAVDTNGAVLYSNIYTPAFPDDNHIWRTSYDGGVWVDEGELSYGYNDEAVAVSHDGSRITFSRGTNEYVVRVGENQPGPEANFQVLAFPGRQAMQSAFSPDDTSLVFVTDKAGNAGDYQLWRSRDDGTGQLQVTSGAGKKMNPDWGTPATVAGPPAPSAPKATIASLSYTGSLKVGQTLTAKVGKVTPSGAKLRYQWYRGTAKIAGATSKTYKVVTADIGKKLKLNVNASKAGYTSVTATYTKSGTVVTVPVRIGAVKYTGSLKVGKKLAAKVSKTVPGGAKLKYQWYRNGKKISGATGKTYTLKSADQGKKIKLRVTATKKNYLAAGKSYTRSGKVARR